MSEIISQGKHLSDLGVALIESIEAAGGDDEDARRVSKDELLRRQIGLLVMGKLPLAKPVGLPTTYDCSLGLVELIRLGLGQGNEKNFNADITQERFPLRESGIIHVNLRVEMVIRGETKEQAAQRLTAAGHTLADTGDLAGFLRDHPDEMVNWKWVHALAENARWAGSGDIIHVPFARVGGAYRFFDLGRLHRFASDYGSVHGVLVRCE